MLLLARLPFDPYTLLAAAPPPRWAGWLGLILLLFAFGLLAWWLFASPLPQPVEPAPLTGACCGSGV